MQQQKQTYNGNGFETLKSFLWEGRKTFWEVYTFQTVHLFLNSVTFNAAVVVKNHLKTCYEKIIL